MNEQYRGMLTRTAFLFSASAFAFWFYRTFPKEDMREGVALMMRFKESLCFPDYEVEVRDLKMPLEEIIRMKELVIAGIMETEIDIVLMWKCFNDGRHYNLKVPEHDPHNIKTVTMEELKELAPNIYRVYTERHKKNQPFLRVEDTKEEF